MSVRGDGDARFNMFFSISFELPVKLENGLTHPSFDDDFPGCDVDFGDGIEVLDEFNDPDELDF